MSEQAPSVSPQRDAEVMEEFAGTDKKDAVDSSGCSPAVNDEVEIEERATLEEVDNPADLDTDVPTAAVALAEKHQEAIADADPDTSKEAELSVPRRSDLTLALAMASLRTTEQKLAANNESDSRQLANNTAWHAASKRLTQWLSENVHKRAASVDEVLAIEGADGFTTTTTTSSSNSNSVPTGAFYDCAPFADVLRASLSEEFQGLADHMWATLHSSLEELATLREERQTLIQNGVELQQASEAQEIQHKVLVACDEEKIQQLEGICSVKDDLISTLQQELLNQKSTVQTLSQALSTNEERLAEKDALITDLVSSKNIKKSSEGEAGDEEKGAEDGSPEVKSTIAHLSEKLQRSEESLSAALVELGAKGSQIATLSRSLDMVGEAHKLELERALEIARKQAEEEGIAAHNNALKQGLNVDTSAVGCTLPTFAEASHFYLQGREEINALRMQLKKQTSRADKVEGLEMSLRAADSRVTHMVSSLAALEEEIQQQRASERRLRGELAALRAEKSTLISQVVQLSLASATSQHQQQVNSNNASLQSTRMNVVTSFSDGCGGDDTAAMGEEQNTSFVSEQDQHQQLSAVDIEQVINDSLSVIHAATIRAAAAAASSSSLVDSASHQELVDAHRKLKSEVNKLGKDKDYLEKLVISRRQRLKTLTTQTLEASITNNGTVLQTASIHQAAEALAILASELATETRGSLTTILSSSSAAAVMEALNDTTASSTSLFNSQSMRENDATGEVATFETISSSLIENVTLKNTVKILQGEVETLKSTISNIQSNQTKPISEALIRVSSLTSDEESATSSTVAVDAVVTVIDSLMNRCGLLGDQNTLFQHSVETVTKTLLHSRKDSEQLIKSLKALQQSLPVITQSVSSALEQHRKMEERLIASRDRIVKLKGSLVEIQQSQIAEQQEMKKQIEMIGSKRPRDEDDDGENNNYPSTLSSIGSAKMLASEAQSVASNVSSLAGALHGLKQLAACRKLIDIIASLEKELDAQQIAHATEIARLGSEFIKSAADNNNQRNGSTSIALNAGADNNSSQITSSSALSTVDIITRNFNSAI